MADRILDLEGLRLRGAYVRLEELANVAGQINATTKKLSAARHHARLYADMVLSASGSSTVFSVDAAAMSEVMVHFAAQLEESIESLANARALTELLGEQIVGADQ